MCEYEMGLAVNSNFESCLSWGSYKSQVHAHNFGTIVFPQLFSSKPQNNE